jgi:hypothetical protein
MADGTLSPNSRELEDSEVVDITKLAPEGHGIAQDVEDILDADHIKRGRRRGTTPRTSEGRNTSLTLASEQRQRSCSDTV